MSTSSISMIDLPNISCGATVRLTVECRIHPSSPTPSNPAYEGLTVDQRTDQNNSHTKYIRKVDLNSEQFPNAQYPHIVPNPAAMKPPISIDTSNDTVVVRDEVIEHISEDEKSTSSDEVFFEEWSEECRIVRTDEFDEKTKQLIRTRYDQRSPTLKGDVIKEEYKEKRQRIKGHHSRSIVKETVQRVAAKSADSVKTLHEEISRKSPQSFPSTIVLSPPAKHNPTWSTEENYITEIVHDNRIRNDIQSTIRSTSIEQEPTVTEDYYVEIHREEPAKQLNIKDSSQREDEWRNQLKNTHLDSTSNGDQPTRFVDRTTALESVGKSTESHIGGKNRLISSIDSEISRTPAPIYESTPKPVRTRYPYDLTHESHVELNDPLRETSSNTHQREFFETTLNTNESDSGIQRTITRNFDSWKSSTKPADSGFYDTPTFTSNQTSRTRIPLRQDLSTTIVDDPTIDIELSDRFHIGQSITKNDTENVYLPDSIVHSSRTPYRPLTTSSASKDDYENLNSYISGTSVRSTVKPLVVDEIKTTVTKTQIDYQVQRKNETEERVSTPPKINYAKRVLVNDQSQPYELLKTPAADPPIKVEESYFSPIGTNRTTPRFNNTLQITSLSSPNQIMFGKQSDREMIAIVRIPELSNSSSMHQEVSESVINADLGQYSRSSRANPSENTSYHSPSLIATRHSASPYSNSYEQQQRNVLETPRTRNRSYTTSLGSLSASNIGFEIEIEKRPPIQPCQPTVIALDQPTRAVVTTSKDGCVTIENLAARPGNTVVIHSDFHASDRSSGYVSADEIRVQPYLFNDSSDEQSKTPTSNYAPSNSSTVRRYKNNDPTQSKLPPYYRPKSSQRSTDNFSRVNELVHRYVHQPPNDQRTNFHEAIDQIDALYNNLDIQTKNTPSNVYNFSKPVSTNNRRKQLAQNPTEYSKRYTSTGFQHTASTNENQHPLSDPESGPSEHHHQWTSSSLTDLVQTGPIHTSQSLSSSGILADYLTPGSTSPNSGYGSTQDMIVHQNRYNDQAQLVRRNRTVTKQRSPTKKTNFYARGANRADDDEGDDGNESPLSDNGSLERQSPATSGSFNFYP